jgi:hypothetical protein
MAREAKTRSKLIHVARGIRALANAIYDDRERFGAAWVSRLELVFDILAGAAVQIARAKKPSLLDDWRM